MADTVRCRVCERARHFALGDCGRGPGHRGRLGGALWRFWLIRGHLSEGRRWLEAALARHTEPTIVRAQALIAAGVLITHMCDYDRAATLFTESQRIATTLGAHDVIGEALYGLGTV